ncbi:MAG: hypothetical protein ABSG43_27075 [Solirubrobacteraceae bacterium]|jgi:hypothetical protein
MHAYSNPIRVFEFDDGFAMLIGGGTNGALYEIGIVDADDAVVIVHAMPARAKFLM